MLKWWKHRYEWKVIGHYKDRREVVFLLFMTASGKRRATILQRLDPSSLREVVNTNPDILLWEHGGPFPRNGVKYEMDALQKLISDMIDEEVKGNVQAPR